MQEHFSCLNTVTAFFFQNLPTPSHSAQELNGPPLGPRENFCPTSSGISSHDVTQMQNQPQLNCGKNNKTTKSSEQRCDASPGNRSLGKERKWEKRLFTKPLPFHRLPHRVILGPVFLLFCSHFPLILIISFLNQCFGYPRLLSSPATHDF